MNSKDKFIAQFVAKGFIELPQDKFPKSLLWQPDLIFKKDDYYYLVLFKTNNNVPPSYLNRIASIPRGNYIPLIIFSSKPSTSIEKQIISLGISVGYFSNGKIHELNIKKKLPDSEVKKEIKKKLQVIDIFLSSKQDIHERKFVEGRIEVLRKSNFYPFNPPHLIEYDKFDIKDLYPHINATMIKCDWIILILEDNHSDVVSYEIKKAIKEFDHKNIFMFVKSTNTCQTVWKKELDKIKNLPTKSIKYLPFSDSTELEVYLNKAIHKRMAEICKKEKVEIYV